MGSLQQSNDLFVVLDMGWKDYLDPYGCKCETSPNLTAFADEVAVFEEAIAPVLWTLRSRNRVSKFGVETNKNTEIGC